MMQHDYHITIDSFGDNCPENWPVAADFLNRIIDGVINRMGDSAFDGDGNLTFEVRDAFDKLWNLYCSGAFDDVLNEG